MSSDDRRPVVLISGGGTAGHVQPGLDIARALVDRGVPVDHIHYVGSERGIETELVPAAGFELTVLPGRGIQRRLTWANVGAVVGLVRAVLTAFGVLRRIRPDVVVSLGGYASVPCALWAVPSRIPIVVAEQNAVPGLANRLIGRAARVCATSFPDVALPRARWTGNPVRDEIGAVDRDEQRSTARQRLGIDGDRFAVAVFGGSLGARRLNQAVVEALAGWQGDAGLAVRHIIGARDHAEMLEAAAPLIEGALVAYQPVRYETDMASVYAAADLVVCRSGATSVAELAVTGTPAVLVPLPGAPGDHQTANARALVDAGAAVLVPDGELDGERLRYEVDRLRADGEALAAMSGAAGAFARPDAAAVVAELVEGEAR
ncbi:MAG: undecaprenyldiphospho-muramoylpentapeptide beta-N-acetylglucosaminyltransferase [Acidimicrobiia bacterium]|nr:undecaprenyldiphospho-muramoylpentapeptide beta-N-acetylglucosaminyltransferase [Acidimicrobiia bacterium]